MGKGGRLAGSGYAPCFAQIWITGYRGVYFRPRGLGGAPDLRITLFFTFP